MTTEKSLRENIRGANRTAEFAQATQLQLVTELDGASRRAISNTAARMVSELRAEKAVSFLEAFLGEYGLSTEEGVALMSMAEAFLRVPDDETLDDLIAEKIAGSNWQSHSGHAPSMLVNASTWALMLTGRLLSEAQTAGLVKSMRSLLKRLGEPVVRVAMAEVMARLGDHFVIGETIEAAVKRARAQEKKGYCFSYDMLGESALTERDAERYFAAYQRAIKALAGRSGDNLHGNAGISVKLSALHPRFEYLQKSRAFEPLLERIRELCMMAAELNVGLSIDAEEAERLDFTLDIIAALLATPALQSWPGLGAVVQAYSRNALSVIDWLHEQAKGNKRRIMLRLVKGAYWDTEIKRAQVLGLADFPVFTHKPLTDVSYLAAARKLLAMGDVIYPQFATHNAHSLCAILAMAGQRSQQSEFEFQRLYGMGQALHEQVREKFGMRHRIYAPVGEHEDLLAYLVRRLLENGANSSFVHQLTDAAIPVENIVADPSARVDELRAQTDSAVCHPAQIYGARPNSPGMDLSNELQLVVLESARAQWLQHQWQAWPLLAIDSDYSAPVQVFNPATPHHIVGLVHNAVAADIESALASAASFRSEWAQQPVAVRAACLKRAADLLQQQYGEFIALLQLESGKTMDDAVSEWREAIDMLRYYAMESVVISEPSRGVFICISPWNFPLAIFTGQVAAALVTGNTVVAKPAEQTPLIGYRMTQLMLEAGVPSAALQLLTGDGVSVGAALCADPRVNGICFTGSVETARTINQQLATHLAPDTALIAETGGINAMIVDSTALPEQTVADIISSAFSSCGQRCSALRILYLQEEVADHILEMLEGAMATLQVGDPLQRETDIGPAIDAAAQFQLQQYIESSQVRCKVDAPTEGYFVTPVIIEVPGIAAIEREIFGPVLHVARFRLEQLDAVVDAINAAGYGLTAAIHSRLAQRVERCVRRLKVGNVYINRNQIGAVVESQPFGGEALSGTGPKAGGPNYLRAFVRTTVEPKSLAGQQSAVPESNKLDPSEVQRLLLQLRHSDWADRGDRWQLLTGLFPQSVALQACDVATQKEMPGPTGELNVYRLAGLDCALCLGPTAQLALEQALQALAFGAGAVLCCEDTPALQQALARMQQAGIPVAGLSGYLEPACLGELLGFSAVSWCGDDHTARALRQSLATRQGPIIRFIDSAIHPLAYVRERHVCSDITSCGGNIDLMTAVGG